MELTHKANCLLVDLVCDSAEERQEAIKKTINKQARDRFNLPVEIVPQSGDLRPLKTRVRRQGRLRTHAHTRHPALRAKRRAPPPAAGAHEPYADFLSGCDSSSGL